MEIERFSRIPVWHETCRGKTSFHPRSCSHARHRRPHPVPMDGIRLFPASNAQRLGNQTLALAEVGGGSLDGAPWPGGVPPQGEFIALPVFVGNKGMLREAKQLNTAAFCAGLLGLDSWNPFRWCFPSGGVLLGKIWQGVTLPSGIVTCADACRSVPGYFMQCAVPCRLMPFDDMRLVSIGSGNLAMLL